MNLAPPPDWIVGLALTAAFGLLALLLRLVSGSGLGAGLAVGTLVALPLGWRGFVVLAVFFALGSGATRVRYRAKAAEGMAERAGGRRGVRSTLANGACAAAAGAAMLVWPGPPPPWLPVAFAGALATALADTLGTEIGQAFGRTTVLLPSLRRVPRGTEGGVSPAGTVAGLAGAAAVGATAAGLALVPWTVAPAVAVAGLLGSLVESLAAGVPASRRVGGDVLNLVNTVAGAILAATLGAALA